MGDQDPLNSRFLEMLADDIHQSIADLPLLGVREPRQIDLAQQYFRLFMDFHHSLGNSILAPLHFHGVDDDMQMELIDLRLVFDGLKTVAAHVDGVRLDRL